MGLRRLAASMAPSVFPAPRMRCISSMNRITFPEASDTSFITDLSRSSNSPLYLAPAISEPISREIRRTSRRVFGTSCFTMRCASPSTMAVLPTPGSPISTGLFFVRRQSTRITRLISSSRPMTGSSSAARAVRSVPYLLSASNWSSPLWVSTRWEPLVSSRAFLTACLESPLSSTIRAISLFANSAKNSESTPRKVSDLSFMTLLASWKVLFNSPPMNTSVGAGDTFGCRLTLLASRRRMEL
mmetsp:Transcript_11215/g.31372  ORF Transcript_11215/g.31372 Transcript_11215/m.31372 type:complete len:243 (-) Transcript_11215:350-1078(-)